MERLFGNSTIQTYLSERNLGMPVDIMIRPGEGDKLRQLEDGAGETCFTEGEWTFQLPQNIPVFDFCHIETVAGSAYSFVWLKYPGDLILLAVFSGKISLEEFERGILYHLLYPVYANHEIKRKQEEVGVLAKRDEIRTRLTNLSLQNLGLEKIVLELCLLTELPIGFADFTFGKQYAPSRKLGLNRGVDELAKLLESQREPLHLDLKNTGKPTHYLYPVLSGSIALGCFIVRLERPMTALDHMIIEQGGTITALEQVKNQSLTELYYRKAYQIFNELIHTNDPSALINKCNELNIDFNANYISLVFMFTSNIDLHLLENCMHRLISRIKEILSDVYQTVFSFENRVTVLASLKSQEQIPLLIDRINRIINNTQVREGLSLCAGMGTLYKGADKISKTFNEAGKALSYQMSRHHSGLVQYSDIGINRLFIHLPHTDAEAFTEEVFGPLRNLSRNQNVNLEETLIAYIETNCSATQTAEKLYIHVNTLYQRLVRIEECLKLSFGNPEDVLRLRLACYMRQSLFAEDG